jgi:MFS family permease
MREDQVLFSNNIFSKKRTMTKAKVFVLGGIGTLLELYDYTLFIVLLPFFAEQIFGYNQSTSLLLGYISFALTFLVAPIGSIIWGWIGDKYGRMNLLRSSIFFMAIPSFFISLLPTYDSVGMLAPIMLILLRIFQGISASGEVQGAKVFVMEHLGRKSYGVAVGTLSAASSFGVMLSMGMGFMCSINSNNPDFWRIPFALGGVLAVMGGIIRRYLTEPNQKILDRNSKISDTFNILRTYSKQTIIALSLAALLGLLSYFMHAFINPFLVSLGAEKQDVYIYSVMGLFMAAIGAITVGFIIDMNMKLILSLRHCLKIFIFFSPLLYLLMLSEDSIGIACGYCGFGALLGAYATIATLTINTLFPSETRCRGALFCYATGVALVGGITPFSLKLLGTVHVLLPGVILIVSAVLVLLVLKYVFDQNITLH